MISGQMTNARLEQIVRAKVPSLQGEPGFWKGDLDGHQLYVVTDESHDRMRIMIPVCELSDADSDTAFMALSANFDRALDVKYALNRGVLWSLFMHPLGSLTTWEVENAVDQVYRLAVNTGSSWSSSDLVFGGGEKDEA